MQRRARVFVVIFVSLCIYCQVVVLSESHLIIQRISHTYLTIWEILSENMSRNSRNTQLFTGSDLGSLPFSYIPSISLQIPHGPGIHLMPSYGCAGIASVNTSPTKGSCIRPTIPSSATSQEEIPCTTSETPFPTSRKPLRQGREDRRCGLLPDAMQCTHGCVHAHTRDLLHTVCIYRNLYAPRSRPPRRQTGRSPAWPCRSRF